MNKPYHQQILLGITGGIAAYKSAELVRQLQSTGATVRVTMTAAATQFITPLTLQALSGHVVHSDLLATEPGNAMAHIELARWADQILIAPCTANFMAKLAHGHADDLLSNICLAATVPISLAPAMNQQMWQNAATQANLQCLIQRNFKLLGPDHGEQACGEIGLGRMLEPNAIVQRLNIAIHRHLSDQHVLITAGPTQEAIDPVRYISNHSSGKMGFALAVAAHHAGAKVTLITGPTQLNISAKIHRIDVTSALEMYDAVLANLSTTDIFIGAAAVADYRPKVQALKKIKKNHNNDTFILEMVKNPDIIATVCQATPRPFCIGFAAETDNLTSHAQTKLTHKGMDMIVANLVGDNAPDTGFNSDHNALQVFWPQGTQSFPKTHKSQLAHQLMTLISEKYHAKNSN